MCVYLKFYGAMLRYVKFEDRHKREVQALVERYFIPFSLKHLQTSKAQITPEMAKLRPILGNDGAAKFVNKHSFVCENEKRNVIGVNLNSYLNQEEFMFRALYQFESFLQLPTKHPIGWEKYALSKVHLYKNINIFKETDDSKVLFVEHSVVDPEYRRQSVGQQLLEASSEYVCCDGDLLVGEVMMEKKYRSHAPLPGHEVTVLNTVEYADYIYRLCVRRFKAKLTQ